MVKEELEYRASVGRYSGKFQAVTHFFGYQGRSSMPSTFDANLAYAYGFVLVFLLLFADFEAISCDCGSLSFKSARSQGVVAPQCCMQYSYSSSFFSIFVFSGISLQF